MTALRWQNDSQSSEGVQLSFTIVIRFQLVEEISVFQFVIFANMNPRSLSNGLVKLLKTAPLYQGWDRNPTMC